MITLMLDQQQSSVVATQGSCEPVHIRDWGGRMIGQIVPGNAPPPGADDRWVECWNEWYSVADDEESEQDVPRSDNNAA